MSEGVKQVIVMRRDLGMRKGKLCSQAAHAAMIWMSEKLREGGAPTLTPQQSQWIDGNFKKITVKVDGENELLEICEKARVAGLQVRLVTDAGLTEFHGVPTKTCCAIGPDYESAIDAVTGDLELY